MLLRVAFAGQVGGISARLQRRRTCTTVYAEGPQEEWTMPVQDLRDWIARVDEMGQLTRVNGADPNLELGGLVDLYQWDMGNPALLFDHIVGYRPGYRLLANVFTSIPRIALSLGLPTNYGPRDFVEAWRTQLKDLQPQPAVLVDR